MPSPAPRVVAVIPARYASTRFPGKPLATIAGKPMIQRVCEQAARTRADEVVVATDDERIRDCVLGFGGRAVMTRTDHATGTDRIAEAVAEVEADLVVNIQGDEPLVPPAVVDELIATMIARPEAAMGTIAVPVDPDSQAATDPNVVKVVRDRDGFALYFSRAPIPYARNERPAGAPLLHHWGIYAFRRDFLMQFVSWPRSDLECCEQLEQLRALDHGVRIVVILSQISSIGVDVPADVARAEALIRQQEAV